MAARVENKKDPKTNREHVAIYTRFAKKGIPITERIQELVKDMSATRKSLNDVKETASAIFKIADRGEFKDNRKAVKVGNAVKHMHIILSHLMDELEKECSKTDMEDFSDLINTPAFNTFLLVASDACTRGDDSDMMERYAIIRESLIPLAAKYNINILSYGEIPEEKGVMMEHELVSKEDIIGHLEANVNAKMGDDIKKLLKLPGKLYMEKGRTYIAFSDKADMSTINSIRKIFNETGTYPPEYRVPEDAGYGILLAEVGSHGYVWILDGSRKIAVKADVYSLTSDERGWDKFRDALNKVIVEAKKLRKNEKAVILSDRGMVRKFIISKD